MEDTNQNDGSTNVTVAEQKPFSLAGIVAKEKQRWVEWGDGFEVLIAYMGKPQMRELYKQCVDKKLNTRTLEETEILNDERFRKYYANKVILDWRGLTPKVLERLLPIAEDSVLPDSIPCTPENKDLLIMQSSDFDLWVANTCRDVEAYNKKRLEEDAKN